METSNPIGLAAGFDKDGEAIDGMNCPPAQKRCTKPRLSL